MSTGISVGLLDDHEVVRDSLHQVLTSRHFDVHGARSPQEFTELLHRVRLDVAVVDLRLSRNFTEEPEGWAVIQRLRHWFPNVGWVLFTGFLTRETAQRALQEGVSSVLDKCSASLEDVVAAVEGASRGERKFPVEYGFLPSVAAAQPAHSDGVLAELTQRERQVLSLVASGTDNLKIAALLGISERTVRAHTSNLYRKLKADNRATLVLLALKAGVQPLDV